MDKARKLCRLRVPADATPYELKLAQQALDAIVSVMNGEVSAEKQAGVLRAAIHLREELLGKPSQRHVVEGPSGGAVKLEFVFNHEEAKRGDDGQSGPARDAVVAVESQLEAPSGPPESPALGPSATNGQA